MSKVFVMGIDGGSFDLIRKWKNDLPNFSKLIDQGTSGYLHTIVPMLTPPAWTSFFTGKNPGKHNIFDFFKIKNYNKELVSSYDRKTSTICDVLSMNNKRSIILGMPANYPPQPFNGIMVCAGDTPSLESDFTYPKEFKNKIFELNPDYKIGPDLTYLEYKKYDEFLIDLYKVTDYHKNLILYLMKNEEWDLFMGIFEDVDRLQHYFWRFMDPDHPEYEKGNKFENAIHDYYIKLDNILGEIKEKLDDAVIFIVSDHGFGPLYKQIFVNNLLMNKNLLKLKEGKEKNNVDIKNFLIKLTYKLKIKHLISRLPEKTRINLRKIIPSKNPDFLDIDWNNTKAYFNSYSGQYLMINLKGRDENGIVEEKEYTKLLNLIKKELFELNDNGKKVIKKVYFGNELFKGDNLKVAPDLFVITEDGYILQEGFNSKLIDFFDKSKNYRSGEHRDNGILIIGGSNVKNKSIDASLLDVFPTILFVLNVEIPEDIDGKLINCFN